MIFRPLLWPTVAALAALTVLVGLGTWQLERLDWKNDLIARIGARIEQDAVALPARAEWPRMELDEWEYRPVTVSGTFDHTGEIHAFTSLPEPRGAFGGPGYWVMTPLRLAEGGTVFVNRGFVPEASKSPDTRPDGLVAGNVELTGLVRLSVEPAMFTPEPNIEKGVWFARNVPAMVDASGLDSAAPFFLDAVESPPGALPQGGETRLAFRNTHLEYAVTWYGLALALLAVYLAYHHAAGRLAFGKRTS